MAKSTSGVAATKKKVAKKTSKKRATTAGKINKSQAIREYAADHPQEGPTAITKALAAKGIKVTPPQVSNVLSAAGKKSTGKRGPKAGGAAAGGDKVSIESLLEAQKFVDKAGGVKSAEKLIGALKKLGN